jgi:hypothetical protein
LEIEVTQIDGTPKFLVGIMHVTKDPWLSIARDGQRPSWEKSRFKNFDVVYFFGKSNRITTGIDRLIESLRWSRGRYASYAISYFLMAFLRPFKVWVPRATIVSHNESRISAHSLKVAVPELTSTMRWKKIAFIDYFLRESKAKYLIISTSSSILNFDVILDFIKKLKGSNTFLYAGPIHTGHDCDFTSGAFTIIDRKAASLLYENRGLIPVHVMDDIGFGSAFKALNVLPIEMKSINIDSIEKLKSYSNKELSEIPHFRLKSGQTNSRNDVEIMLALTAMLEAKLQI